MVHSATLISLTLDPSIQYPGNKHHHLALHKLHFVFIKNLFFIIISFLDLYHTQQKKKITLTVLILLWDIMLRYFSFSYLFFYKGLSFY